MDKIQDYLRDITKGRSVPRVFIKGKFFGGGDECASGARNGKLKGAIAGIEVDTGAEQTHNPCSLM